jgi:hypothetical protein
VGAVNRHVRQAGLGAPDLDELPLAFVPLDGHTGYSPCGLGGVCVREGPDLVTGQDRDDVVGVFLPVERGGLGLAQSLGPDRDRREHGGRELQRIVVLCHPSIGHDDGERVGSESQHPHGDRALAHGDALDPVNAVIGGLGAENSGRDVQQCAVDGAAAGLQDTPRDRAGPYLSREAGVREWRHEHHAADGEQSRERHDPRR